MLYFKAENLHKEGLWVQEPTKLHLPNWTRFLLWYSIVILKGGENVTFKLIATQFFHWFTLAFLPDSRLPTL